MINDSLVQVIDSLKTTNVNQQDLISSLQALIAQLQTQIQNFQTQISLLGDNAGLADCIGSLLLLNRPVEFYRRG